MPPRLTTQIRSYCDAHDIKVPVGFTRHPANRYAIIKLHTDPPTLLAKTFASGDEVQNYFEHTRPEHEAAEGVVYNLRILDFKEGIERQYVGTRVLTRGARFMDAPPPKKRVPKSTPTTRARDRFQALLNSDFYPLLRAAGFRGSGRCLRRVQEPLVQVVSLQGDRYGGSCAVNLGVGLTFLPRMPSLKQVLPGHCAIETRLAEAGATDHWWEYGHSDSEAAASVSHLMSVYREQGIAFFSRFEPFADAFTAISPECVEQSWHSFRSPTQCALVLAQIAEHLGQLARARQFATLGLRLIKPHQSRVPELERLSQAG